MNSKRAKKLKRIAVEISAKDRLSFDLVYKQIKKISNKNKNIKI